MNQLDGWAHRWGNKPSDVKVAGTPRLQWKEEDEEEIRLAAEEVLYGVTFMRVKKAR